MAIAATFCSCCMHVACVFGGLCTERSHGGCLQSFCLCMAGLPQDAIQFAHASIIWCWQLLADVHRGKQGAKAYLCIVAADNWSEQEI